MPHEKQTLQTQRSLQPKLGNRVGSNTHSATLTATATATDTRISDATAVVTRIKMAAAVALGQSALFQLVSKSGRLSEVRRLLRFEDARCAFQALLIALESENRYPRSH
jgi:hypothetical protein